MAGKSKRRNYYETWLEPEKLAQLAYWRSQGMTIEDIAKNVGVAPTTLYDWQNKYADISNALKIGLNEAVSLVAGEMFQKALGTGKPKTTVRKRIWVDESGERREFVEEVTEQPVPDLAAQIFWLKNRAPNEWRDEKYITRESPLPEQLDDYITYIDKRRAERAAEAEAIEVEDADSNSSAEA